MSRARDSSAAWPFFLTASPGQRYCLFHPAQGRSRREALIYVHPFGDEMNKSRRMAALQSRRLAQAGFDVLQIDLFGCGDSSGDIGDASLDLWREDLGLARAWLEQQAGADRIGLWGLRLGALLALDRARREPERFSRLLLWQPPAGGRVFLNQFLRMRLAGDMLAGDGSGTNGVTALRARLAAGESLEVGGYLLRPGLAAALEQLDMEPAVTTCPVYWIELVMDENRQQPDSQLPPGSARIAARWQDAGADLRVRAVCGQPFWTTQEISECRELLTATEESLAGAMQ